MLPIVITRSLGLALASALALASCVALRADEPVSRWELEQLRGRIAAQEAELRALREELPGGIPVVRLPRAPDAVSQSDGPTFAISAADSAPQPPGDWREKMSADVRKLQAAEDQRKADAAKEPGSKITAELQADNYYFGQDANNRATVGDIDDGSVFRRARVGWLGTQDQTEWRLQIDFALPGRPSFLDVFAGLNDLPLVNNVRVGHFFEPFSLERMTTNRFVTFMERSLADQPFAPARNLGIVANDWSEDEMMTWSYGVFAGNSNPFGDQQSDSDETALTGRFTRLLWYDEASQGRNWFHLGFCYSIREPNQNLAQFQSQPEARLGSTTPNVPFFVNTGQFGSHFFQLYDLELAWIQGPFSMQAEFFFVPVDRIGGPDPFFNAWYVTASYFLTGEHRPYRRRWGTFDRVEPREHFVRACTSDGLRTGTGAWEIATRVSHLNLNDNGIQGGRLTDLTVGLNWYMTTYLRFTSNYIHAFLDNPTFGNSGANILGMRIQYDF